jgi:hypothetical protein
MQNTAHKEPILFVDVDGVISLFGFPPNDIPGTLTQVDGIAHCIGHHAGDRLNRLAERYELVWATGWEDRANDHLPFLLGWGSVRLPTLTFGGRARFGSSHWKVDAVDLYAGERPAAWIDDNLDERCHAWADGRNAPTLLVETDAATGITEEHVVQLWDWAESLSVT